MKSNRLCRCILHLVVLLLGATNVAAESPTVHIEHQALVDEPGGLRYVLAEGTMSGTVRGDATYTIPVQIHYPTDGGNRTAVLELTNSALLLFYLAARSDRVDDRRSDADDIDELEAMQVNFGWAGAREYLLRNGFTHIAIQYSKAVTDFMGESPPEGRSRRRLGYGRIERASDGYEIVRDAARWLAAPGALTGDAPPVARHGHVIAYGLSGPGYFLRDYLIRGENARGEIDGFFVHAAGSQCLALIDDTAECPHGSMCVESPRFYHWFTCPGPPPTNGAKVLAVDAQSDLEFNDGALARESAIDDPDYVRWEVAGAPHVPVFAMDLTRLGAPHQNQMDWSPIWRSAFHYLDRWVKHGTAPPTAPSIEGQVVSTEDGDVWKCDLDADGNALGGIRLPPIEAPMGVYTGFDFSWLNPAVSNGHRYAKIFAYGGRFERFSDETLAERYPTEADYKEAFEAAARRAFDAGYILEEDLRRYTAAPPSGPGPVVETMSGKVRGVVDGDVVSFKGIPFAAPPVGELRWRAPQPTASWEGVRDVTEFGSHCPQAPFFDEGTFGAEVEEDCLYLNVWAPRQRGAELLPVMFWIHGGGFVNGGTADGCDGLRLAGGDVILVSANYRLGRFGFFAHPALTAENAHRGRLGNYAIMDQIAALQWVQDNIAAFGGDRENVTIFGGSAGGLSVHHLMTAPTAKGLFARAIAQSGLGREHNEGQLPFLPLTARAGEPSAEAAGMAFAVEHGIEGTDAQALSELRALPASSIAGELNMATMFTPTFTGPIGDTADVPAHFEELYRAGKAAPVPLIVGATDADGFFGFYQRGDREQIFSRFGGLRAEAEAIYDPAGDRDAFHIGTLVSADSMFIEPARHVARLHASHGHPTFVYRFSYVPDHIRAQRIGASHASELAFVFGTLEEWSVAATESDRRVSDEIQAYWVEFAKSGVPEPGGLPTWPPHETEADVILDFRLEGPTVGPDPARERLDFAERAAESERRIDHYFDSDGIRIRYIDVGPRDGEPIVLIHGGFSSVDSGWIDTGVIDALDDDHRVIALDLRGHGKSEKPHDPARYGAEFASDVIRLLDHLGIEQAHIASYSMGGHITFKLVADHPDRIRSAMPCGDGGRPASGAFADALRRTIASLDASVSMRPLLNYFVTPGSMNAEEVDALDAAICAGNDTEAMAAMLRNWQGMDADPARLAANRVPCLAVIGEGDPLRSGLDATARIMSNLHVEVIKGHDHMTAFQDPELVAAIKAFVGAHAAVEGQYFDSNGVRIRYVDRGPRDGEPVVLVHGFTQSIETAWGDPGVIEVLDDDHRVVALDCRGHGRSDKPHDQNEYGDAMVSDVIHLLDHLGIETAHVVGYSMGGRIVFKLLADHPERLLSAMPCGMGWDPPSPDFEAGLEWAARALEETGSIRAKIEHMVSDDAAIERIEAVIRVSNDTKALAAVQRGIPALRPDHTKLEANAVPCLAIIGEHDALREPVDAMAEYMGNLEVTIIEGADHGTAFRDPAFVAAIKAFIAEYRLDAMKQ